MRLRCRPDGNYQAKLPDGFKMPEGLGEFVFDEADPAFVDLKRWAAGQGSISKRSRRSFRSMRAPKRRRKPLLERRRLARSRNSARMAYRV